MQTHERVRIVLVPAGRISPIHQDDLGVAIGDQSINERHARRTAAHDEVVRFECFGWHDSILKLDVESARLRQFRALTGL